MKASHLPLRGLALLLALVASEGASAAQVSSWPLNDLLVADAPVTTMLEHNGTLYLGGRFTMFGVNSGSGLVLNGTTGAIIPDFPQVDGPILAVAPDASGGFYIAGEFNIVGGIARPRLAHIKADKTVDTTFVPAPNGRVLALTLSGNNLYVGGEFTNIGRQPRNRVAALAATTGAASAWNPNVSGPVRSLTLSGSRVYVGGEFTNVAGIARSNLASVDAIEGAVLPSFDPAPDGPVNALALSDTDLLLIGGSFTNVGAQLRTNAAAVHAFTGLVSEWAPNPNGPVFTMSLNTGTAYLGGSFTSAGGQARNNLAAIDMITGKAKAWNPSPVGRVRALAFVNGNLAVGGAFTNASSGRTNLAIVDTSTGAILPWTPPTPGGEVLALGSSTDSVFVGGAFQLSNPQYRGALAAIDLGTRELTEWSPHLENASGEPIQVNILARDADTIYAAGHFTAVDGQPHTNLAALDLTNGEPADWHADIEGEVLTLAVSTNFVYVGGAFTNVSGSNKVNLASIDRSTGLISDWDPNPNGRVQALFATNGTLYVGGAFTTIDGQPRRRIASFDLGMTNTLKDWAPEASGSAASTVLAIAPFGNSIFVGGSFNSIGGQFRTNMAALDPLTAAALDWAAPANNAVWTITPFETNLYLGGDFSSILGIARSGAAVVGSVTPDLGSWAPTLRGRILSIVPQTNQIVVAGSFTNFASETSLFPVQGIAFFGPAGYTALIPRDRANGINQLEVHLRHNLGEPYEIEFSTNLTDWQPIATNRNNNVFTRPITLSETNRSFFYRTKVVLP